jgi:thioesterase domain-containing protein
MGWSIGCAVAMAVAQSAVKMTVANFFIKSPF